MSGFLMYSCHGAFSPEVGLGVVILDESQVVDNMHFPVSNLNSKDRHVHKSVHFLSHSKSVKPVDVPSSLRPGHPDASGAV